MAFPRRKKKKGNSFLGRTTSGRLMRGVAAIGAIGSAGAIAAKARKSGDMITPNPVSNRVLNQQKIAQRKSQIGTKIKQGALPERQRKSSAEIQNMGVLSKTLYKRKRRSAQIKQRNAMVAATKKTGLKQNVKKENLKSRRLFHDPNFYYTTTFLRYL